MPLLEQIYSSLKTREAKGMLRKLTVFEPSTISPSSPLADFSSNDYLSIATSKELKEHFLRRAASGRIGGSTGSRLLDGNNGQSEAEQVSSSRHPNQDPFAELVYRPTRQSLHLRSSRLGYADFSVPQTLSCVPPDGKQMFRSSPRFRRRATSSCTIRSFTPAYTTGSEDHERSAYRSSTTTSETLSSVCTTSITL